MMYEDRERNYGDNKYIFLYGIFPFKNIKVAMTAVTNGNRIEPIDSNRSEALNLGEAINSINLNGGNISIKHLDKLYYTDQRRPKKTLWQTFAEAFANGAGWTTGAAVVTYVGYAIFNIIKAKIQKPGK